MIFNPIQKDVDEFMSRKENDNNATGVLKSLDEQHTKYRFMEHNLMNKKRRLKKQIPEIETSLNVLKFVKKRKEGEQNTDAQFLLSDHVYMGVNIPPTEKVCLWLGVSQNHFSASQSKDSNCNSNLVVS